MFRPLLLLLFLITTALQTWAQESPDILLADTYYVKAENLYEIGKRDSSVYYMQKAAAIYLAAQDWEKYISALNRSQKGEDGMEYYLENEILARKALQLSKKYLGEEHLETAKAMYEIGRNLFILNDIDQAELYFQQALAIRLNKLDSNHVDIGNSYLSLGNVYLGKESYDLTLEYYQKALEIFIKTDGEQSLKVARIYDNIGFTYTNNNSLDLALFYQNKCLQMREKLLNKNHVLLGRNLLALAQIYSIMQQYNKAGIYYESALQILRTHSHPYMANAYYNLGFIHYYKGAVDNAIEYFNKALVITMERYPENHPLLGAIYSDMASIYVEIELYDLALDNFQKALQNWRLVYGEKGYFTGVVYEKIGAVYEKMDDFDQAKKYFQKSFKIINDYPEKTESMVAYLNDMAHLYSKQGNYKKTIETYKRALQLQIKAHSNNLHPNKDWEEAALCQRIGETYFKLKDYQRALRYYQNSLIANIIDFNDSVVYSNPLIHSYLDQNGMLNSLQLKAEALKAIFDQNKEIKNLQFSLETFQLCDTLIDKIRQSHQRHSDKVAFGKTVALVYEQAIQVCLRLHEVTENKDYLQQAFYFSERNKAGVLNESLIGQQAKQFANLPDSTLEFEQTLKADLAYNYGEAQKLRVSLSGYDTAQLSYFENKHFRTNEKLDSLKLALESSYPNYYQMKYQNSMLNVEQVQHQMSPNQALISFFDGENKITRFVVTKKDFKVDHIEKDSLFIAQQTSYLDSFDWDLVLNYPQKAYDKFTNSSYALYEKLLSSSINSLDTEVSQLIIVPDGKLSHVPWDLLIRTKPKSLQVNYKTLDYLFNDFAISYAHSASLLFQKSLQLKKATEKSILAFAPSYPKGVEESYVAMAPALRSALVPLKWNNFELDAIAAQFGGSFFSGALATERAFKEQAGKYQTLHLAMHALVDNDHPMESGLVFTHDNDSIEDGMLHIYELFNMELAAEMTVLSACNTGIGQLQKGEGVMSLGRAFSYAGCPSIVMSHWSVDDESTSQLMGLFYKNLSEHMGKDEALRQARKAFLSESSIKQHPMYWGGFVVVGETSPLTTSLWNVNWYWLAAIVIILSLIIAVLIVKKIFTAK